MEPLEVTHVFTHLRMLGGGQSMLRNHLNSSRPDFLQRAVVVFEDSQSSNVVGLDLKGWHSPKIAQTRWKRMVPQISGCASYLNAWGAGFFAPLDGCQRRVAVLATAWPGDKTYLSALQGRFDFVMGVSQPLLELAHEALGLPDDRLSVIPVPIQIPSLPERAPRSFKNRPLVLGYCGRLITAQKRVERLPPIAQALAAAGIEHRWEIIGEGPVQGPLAKQFATVGATVQFRGRLSGEAYWEAIRGLDFIVFTSDYEGTPLSLAEAMSQGVLPLYAKMNSGGDHYTEQIHPGLLFPADRPELAAAGVRTILGLSPSEWLEMESKARSLAQGHADNAYVKQFEAGVRKAFLLPKISQVSPPNVSTRFGLQMPFAVLSRLNPENPLRRGLG